MSDYDKYWDFLGGLASLAGRRLPERIDTLVEYGGGYSTFFFSLITEMKKSSAFCSVDQYGPYLARLTETMPKGNQFTPLLAELYSEDRLKDDPRDTLYYATSPLSLGKPFDLCLIDGRTRAECLLVAALASSPDALIILDDSDRVRYAPAMMLFEEVEHIIRFRVLKLCTEAAPLRDRFVASLSRFTGKSVAPPKAGRPGGMLHVPTLSPLTQDERAALSGLPGAAGSKLCWGARDAIVAIGDPQGIYISDKANPGGAVASVTGHMMDNSKDPNLNYSTAPLAFKRRFDSIVVAGQRRNECLLTSAWLLNEDGRVYLRDPECLTFAPGLALYDRVESRGPFGVFRLNPTAAALVKATRGVLESRLAKAAITHPGEAAS